MTTHLVGFSWKRCHVEHEFEAEYWPPLFNGETLLVRFDKEELHVVAPHQISVVGLHMVGAPLPSVDINLFNGLRIVDFRVEIFDFFQGYSVRYSDLKLCILQEDIILYFLMSGCKSSLLSDPSGISEISPPNTIFSPQLEA